MTSYTFDPAVNGYTVQEGDTDVPNSDCGECTGLEIEKIELNFGSVMDDAGNSIEPTHPPDDPDDPDDAPEWNVITDENFAGKEIQIDGNSPAAFTLNVVTPVGGTVYAEEFTDVDGDGFWDDGEEFTDEEDDGAWDAADYWNESNTSATMQVTLEDDASLLDGGTIQITGTIGDQTYNIGSAYTILADNLNTDVTMTVDAADIEGNESFVENASITFSAVVTDKAGNSRSGTAGDAILVVDQLKPEDLEIESIVARDSGTGTVIVPGYLNTTNAQFLVDVNFDGTDNSLYKCLTGQGGSIEVLARPVGEATFVTIAAEATIESSDADVNKKLFIINQFTDANGNGEWDEGEDPSTLLDADGNGYDPGFEDIDTENVKVEFRARVTDLAGNMTEQDISEHTVLVDKILVSEVVLSYEPAFVNETATGVIVTATMLEPTHGWNNTDEDDDDEQRLDDILHIRINYPGALALTDTVDAPMVPLGFEEFTDEDDDGVWDDGEEFTDLDGDAVWDAGDSTVWTYTFDIPDAEDNAGSPPFWVVGTDQAGNPITGITGDPDTEVQENTTGLVITQNGGEPALSSASGISNV
jgi:hypothetical protein